MPDDLALISPSNRAFRYGDGLFETIRMFEGRLPFLDFHWKRLSEGMKALKMEVPAAYSDAFFRQEVERLTNGTGNWRIRLQVWRQDGGLYLPAKNTPDFLLSAAEEPTGNFRWNHNGLSLCLFPEAKLYPTLFSRFKTCQSLPFILAALHRQTLFKDDCLLLNHENQVVCGGSSNVFWVKKGCIFTPPLSAGCVAGTIRTWLFENVKRLNINILEKQTLVSDLETADEIFLTNAVHGVRWVAACEGVSGKLNHEVSRKIYDELAHFVIESKEEV